MSKPTREPVRTATAEVAVVFTCEWCGERVELTEGELGPIVNLRAFLAVHARCIHRLDPREPVD